MTFASQSLTFGQMNAIVKKLGGEEGALRFLRGELAVSMAIPPEYPIWKTVKLGLHKSSDEYRSAIKSARMKIGSWGDNIIGRITCLQEETEVDLVVLSVGELGFKDRAMYSDICAKANELGLELCPAEVGPALRLQYPDQLRDEWLHIAMEAITDWDGGGRDIFFVVRDDGGLWLIGYFDHPGRFWLAGDRLAFVRRK